MKTHITLEQLNSLTEYGRENQWRYFGKGIESELNAIGANARKQMDSITMDIPTMIEYLGDKWVTYLRKMDGSFPSNDRLCDELWEVIKELLED